MLDHPSIAFFDGQDGFPMAPDDGWQGDPPSLPFKGIVVPEPRHADA
jgi:hypothetical protein